MSAKSPESNRISLNVQGTTSMGPLEWLGQSLVEILNEGQNLLMPPAFRNLFLCPDSDSRIRVFDPKSDDDGNPL